MDNEYLPLIKDITNKRTLELAIKNAKVDFGYEKRPREYYLNLKIVSAFIWYSTKGNQGHNFWRIVNERATKKYYRNQLKNLKS